MSNPCILTNNICPSNVNTINVVNNNCYTGCHKLRENKNYHIRELLNRDSDGDYYAKASNNQKFNDSVKKNDSCHSGIKNHNNKYT